MRTRLEVFQRLDSRFRGNDKQGGNDEGDDFPWSPYPKLGFITWIATNFVTKNTKRDGARVCKPWRVSPWRLEFCLSW